MPDFPLVMFFADRHKYYAKGYSLMSASGLIQQYEWPFRRNYWLTYKAIKGTFPVLFKELKDSFYPRIAQPPKDFFDICADHMTPEQIALVRKEKALLAHDWEIKNATACYRGTKFHLERELVDLAQEDGVINPVTGLKQKVVLRPDTSQCDNASVVRNLRELPDGYYPELVIFHLVHDSGKGVVGQVDRAWIWTDEVGVRHYTSDDWKTNWKKRDDRGRGNYRDFLDHLTTSKTNHYGLQASIYAYMMELAGYRVNQLRITYVKDFDVAVSDTRVLPYLREEVMMMFDNYLYPL